MPQTTQAHADCGDRAVQLGGGVTCHMPPESCGEDTGTTAQPRRARLYRCHWPIQTSKSSLAPPAALPLKVGGGLRGVGPRDPAMCQQAPPSRRTWRTWAPALGRASCRLQQPCGESLGVNQMFHGLARARLPSFRGPTSCRFCGNAGDCPRVTQAWG
ncbi:uncharacterized protein LOC118917952 isoform X8 [Manis pentadactyla]|uniref:uncharacterized protein LOC118917952 isoform X8 n=1 Tax=Manis pentadactyla TaxID=143292 RepID=UPI00255C8D88|nr:uncharacterized protein LOC118917952 isoform X8 [Manis pentadactyla]